MLELPEAAREYKECFQAWNELDGQAASDPLIADSVRAQMDTLGIVMEALEPQALTQFAEVAQYEAPVDEALEARRGLIESLRDSEPYKNGTITEDRVLEMLDALPPPHEVYDDQDVEFGKALIVSRCLRSLLLNAFVGGSVFERAGVEQADTPPAGDTHEADSSTVQIDVYRGDNMLVIDGVSIPLARSVDLAKYTAEEELLVEAYRLRALEFLAANQGEHTAREIWEAIDYTGTDYDTAIWYNFIGDFLATELNHRDEAVVSVTKPTPDAKIRHYAITSDIELVFHDGESGELQLTLFKLPDGTVMAGREGKVMHLLMRTDEQRPLTREMLLKYGIYSEDEIAALSRPATALTSVVSSILSRLRKSDLTDVFDIQKVVVNQNAETSRPIYGYWMNVVVPEAPDVASSQSTEETDDNIPDATGEEQSKTDKEQLLRTEHALARYIQARNGLLVELGLPPIEQSMYTDLAEAAELPQPLDHDNFSQLFVDLTPHIEEILDDPKGFAEAAFARDSDTPGWGLLDYLITVTSDSSIDAFRKAMNAEVIEVYEQAGGKVSDREATRLVFDVDGERISVDSNGHPAVEHGLRRYLPRYDAAQRGLSWRADKEVPLSTKSKRVGGSEAEVRHEIEQAVTASMKQTIHVFTRGARITDTNVRMPLQVAEGRMGRADLEELLRPYVSRKITLSPSTPVDLRTILTAVAVEQCQPDIDVTLTNRRYRNMIDAVARKLIADEVRAYERSLRATKQS